jgi:hypothetical protein
VLALGVGACGGGSGGDTSGAGTTATPPPSTTDTTTAEETGTTAKTGNATEPAAAGAASSCASHLEPLLDQLDHLRKSLVIGVSYEQYVAELETVRRTYANIPVGELDLACLSGAAAGAEESFDGYLAAANTWGDCVSETGCETVSLEPKLQRMWKAAAAKLRAAQRIIRLNE